MGHLRVKGGGAPQVTDADLHARSWHAPCGSPKKCSRLPHIGAPTGRRDLGGAPLAGAHDSGLRERVRWEETMTVVRFVVALISLVLTLRASAWDDFGHMTVAAVAWEQLSPELQQRATALLKLNPNYQAWIANVPPENADEVAFVRAATWPDAIKRDATYKNDGEQPSGPDAGKNVGYGDLLQHRYWHFVDQPFSPDGTPVHAASTPNAETQIVAFRQTLASPNAPDELKSYDLVWLLHLVGDVHQPLHATSRFDHQQPNGDRGGNSVALCKRPCKDELHGFWDDVLGKSEKPADAIAAARRIASADPGLAGILDESTWIQESFHLARTAVYVKPIGIGPGPFTLDQRYRSAAQAVAEKRVALAGARLAGILKAALH